MQFVNFLHLWFGDFHLAVIAKIAGKSSSRQNDQYCGLEYVQHFLVPLKQSHPCFRLPAISPKIDFFKNQPFSQQLNVKAT